MIYYAVLPKAVLYFYESILICNALYGNIKKIDNDGEN